MHCFLVQYLLAVCSAFRMILIVPIDFVEVHTSVQAMVDLSWSLRCSLPSEDLPGLARLTFGAGHEVVLTTSLHTFRCLPFQLDCRLFCLVDI